MAYKPTGSEGKGMRLSRGEGMITNLGGGVWTIHDEGQRPVEGIGVYEYIKFWTCEVHRGAWLKDSKEVPCEHIIQVLKESK